MFAVGIAPRAVADVARILRWWRKNRPASPALFEHELDTALLAIAERPEIGPRIQVRSHPHARAYVLQRSGYVILYDVEPVEHSVTIVRVRHGRRRALARRRR